VSSKEATEPNEKEPSVTVAANFRFPAALVRALDDWAKVLNDRNPLGRRWTRTDLAQECLAHGVRAWGEKGLPPNSSSGKA